MIFGLDFILTNLLKYMFLLIFLTLFRIILSLGLLGQVNRNQAQFNG